MDAPPVQYVTTSDGYKIAYCITGEGQPLVWMPAAFSNLRGQWRSETYRPQFEALAAEFTLIQYDSRGEGMSTRGLPENLLLDHFELDLEAVMDAVAKRRSEPVVLVGPMVSGHVAVRYAVAHPERVSALVLFQANLDDPLEGVRYLEPLATESWENFLKIPAYNFYRFDSPTQALSILQAAMSQEDFLRHLRLPATSIRDLLPELRIPVLVIAIEGAYGPRISGDEEGRRIAALAPTASLLVLAPGGHSYGTAIADFIANLPPSTERTVWSQDTHAVAGTLSSREIEVLRLLAAGKSNQQIADELVISVNTVNRHVSNIYAKTGAANRAEAATYAARNGIA